MEIKDYIRDDIWKAIEQHYCACDYTEALRDASFLLKDILQAKSGEYDKDNTKLVEAVLLGQNPILKINNFSTRTERDMQSGVAFGIKGIFMHVRNPISHEKILYDKKDADAILLYIDYLVRQVDKSYGVTLIDEWLPLLEDDSFTSTEEYAEELIKELPKKRTYELLEAIYENRLTITKYKTLHFLRRVIGRLTSDEREAFIGKLNIDLAQTHGGNELSMFFHFFGEYFYKDLKKVVKLRIEDVVLQGIKSATYNGNSSAGKNAAVATWAADFIENFETKEKCVKAIRDKIFESEEEQKYVLKFFRSFVDLNSKEVLSVMESQLKRRLPWDKNAYEYVKQFFYDKQDELYLQFKEEIDCFEEKNVAKEDRIPDKIDMPF